MGCGAHLLVVGAEQKDEQRLRKAVRDERSVHPGGDDTADGEAPGTQMRLFRRFHRNCPKSLGHAYNITLPATKMVLFGRCGIRIPAKSTVGALLLPLYRQFLEEM